MHAPALGRTRTALAAGAALALSLAFQPLVATPASAGVNCGSTFPPPIGDCTPPETRITKNPQVFSESRTALFEFTTVTADDDDPGVTFECRLERGFAAPYTLVEDWQDCSVTGEAEGVGSLGKKLYENLAPGDYTFSVRATDVADDLLDPPAPIGSTNTEQSPAQFQWNVSETAPDDDVDPNTTITSTVKRWHLFRFIGISYEADEETMGFVCKANGQEIDCTDHQANIFAMGPKDWTFTVAAIDAAGNVDPTPAVLEWSVPRSSGSMKGISDGWKRNSGKGYFLDSYLSTKKRGQYVNMTKDGFREMALVATKCPECGSVDILFEGKLVKHVDLASKKRKQRTAIPLGSWKKAQSGHVKIVVTSKRRPVIVEGFGFSMRRTR